MIERNISDKILIVGPDPKMKGGIAQVLDTYFSEVFESKKFIPETIDRCKLLRIGTSLLATIRLFWTLQFDKNIKIVHFHTASGISLKRTSIYARIARLYHKKVILHIHGANFKDYYNSNKDFVRKTLVKASSVVALSNSWKQFFVDELSLGNVTVIPNIMATPQIENTAKFDKEIIEALFLGQIGERKGIFDLLQAINNNKMALKRRFKLHIGGNGETERVIRYIKENSLDDIAEFHGWVSGEAKSRLLAQSSIYILPSYSEGLPISILEAMANRQAIISTPVGGIPEVVDNTNGVLIEPQDIDSLGKEIVRLVHDKSLVKKMGEASLIKAAPHFPKNISKDLYSLYTRLLDGE